MLLSPKKTDKILAFSDIRKELLLVSKLVLGETNYITTLSALLHLKLH